jgi:RNA polymerase sigma-70 factor, ECF subfamily
MTSALVRDPLADQRSPLAGVHSMDRALLVKIAVSRAGQRRGDGSLPATIAARESGEDSVGAGQREAALQELHDRHAGELWRFAMRLTHDRQLSEDVVQEALLKAWKDPGLGQRDEAAARARLFTASRNLIIDKWRSAASRHEQRIEEPPEENVGDTTSVVLDRWLIAEALTSLSAEHRSVISAAYYEGRSVADVSARLRIPEGTVKSRLHYGLRALRLALQEKGMTRP